MPEVVSRPGTTSVASLACTVPRNRRGSTSSTCTTHGPLVGAPSSAGLVTPAPPKPARASLAFRPASSASSTARPVRTTKPTAPVAGSSAERPVTSWTRGRKPADSSLPASASASARPAAEPTVMVQNSVGEGRPRTIVVSVAPAASSTVERSSASPGSPRGKAVAAAPGEGWPWPPGSRPAPGLAAAVPLGAAQTPVRVSRAATYRRFPGRDVTAREEMGWTLSRPAVQRAAADPCRCSRRVNARRG